MDERQIIDTLSECNTYTKQALIALENNELEQVESLLEKRFKLLQQIPPIEHHPLSVESKQYIQKILTDIVKKDELGLENALVKQSNIRQKLSAGRKAQQGVLKYIANKV